MGKITQTAADSTLDADERQLIRREFGTLFGQPCQLADGIMLRTWASGPQKGSGNIPPVLVGMIARGLVEVRPGKFSRNRAFLTRTVIDAIRATLAANVRFLDPGMHGHLWPELGLQPPGG